MPFTDDQIKLLETNQYELFGFSKEHVKALLARLSAAEAALKDYKSDAEETVLYAEWKKASGKEPK